MKDPKELLNLQFGLKVVELVLFIICIIIIHSAPLSLYAESYFFFTVVFVGGFIFCAIFVIAGIVLDNLSGASKMILLHLLVGSVLSIVNGILFISYNQDIKKGKSNVACGSLLIVNGIVYTIDLVLSYLRR